VSEPSQSVLAQVEVAAGVLIGKDGTVLLARRPEGKVYAGYWEFPGGKLEPGETPAAALVRELREELAIGVTQASSWITQRFAYPHARVHIRFFRVWDWEGDPRPVEHSALAWQHPGRFSLTPMLPANTSLLKALELPDEYAVSDAGGLGRAVFLAALERRLSGGLRLVQLREKNLSTPELGALMREVQVRCDAFGARLMLNADPADARALGASGLHLSAARLASLERRPEGFEWTAASCHTREELEKAARIGLDFAVLGPVQATASHPGSPTLGWAGFSERAGDLPLPVYAIGGMQPGDRLRARAHGAHGIAMIRGAWAP
jgi:8-oxo-dGTP diphosphatase